MYHIYGNLYLKALISIIFISCFIIYHIDIDKLLDNILNKRKKLNINNIEIARYQACKYIINKDKRVRKIMSVFTKNEEFPERILRYLDFIPGITKRIESCKTVKELEIILDEFDEVYNDVIN